MVYMPYTHTIGIVVNEYLQTSNPDIYSAGDCTTKYQFTHIAGLMGEMVAFNALLDAKRSTRDMLVPWCTYTHPEISHVGHTIRDLESLSIDYGTYTSTFGDRAHCEGQKGTFCTVYFNKLTGVLYGATIVGDTAGDIISEISMAMKGSVTLEHIAQVIHPYGSSLCACLTLYVYLYICDTVTL